MAGTDVQPAWPRPAVPRERQADLKPVREATAQSKSKPGPKGPQRNPDLHPLPHAGGKPGVRTCLRCRKDFESAGVGERVCGDCKLKPSYRAGPFVDELAVIT